MRSTYYRVICLGVFLLSPVFCLAAREDDARSAKTFLQEYFASRNSCMVIGFVDADGSNVIAAGKLDNGANREVNGDTVFFIGSVSKTFTALLLQGMAERGELKLDDPVAKYLPASVKLPTHGGKQITLVDLATQSAGLPVDPNNMKGKDGREQYESYTVERMYAFLSSSTLSRDPGAEFGYSNLGMALLGHAEALKANSSFESLVIDRICRPLHMDNTCLTLTPELNARLAMGHEKSGERSSPWKLQAYAPAGGVHSTANDLLKYAAAQAGLTTSELTPAIEKTHVIRHTDTRGMPELPALATFGQTAMCWTDRGAYQAPGMRLLAHAGGAGSYHAWVGFDMKQHRGIVVLTTDNNLSVEAVGWTLLQRKPLTAQSAKDFARDIVGIGVALDMNKETGALGITRVFADSPAAQGGLTSGLVIKMVDDVPLEGKSLEACMKLLRGNVGTKVRLEVLASDGKTSSVELTRQKFLIAQ